MGYKERAAVVLGGCLLSVGLCAWLYLYGRGLGLRKIHLVEWLAGLAVVMFAEGIFMHKGFNGAFFTCLESGCSTTALPWLIGYPLACATLPIAAILTKRPFRIRAWICWLAASVALFFLSWLLGGIHFKWVYHWFHVQIGAYPGL